MTIATTAAMVETTPTIVPMVSPERPVMLEITSYPDVVSVTWAVSNPVVSHKLNGGRRSGSKYLGYGIIYAAFIRKNDGAEPV